MKHISAPSLALATLSLGATLGRAALATRADMSILSEQPEMPYDPSTVAGCTYWYDNDGSVSCNEIPFVFGVTQAQFDYWNPIAAGCKNFPTGKSYCVEGPAPPATTKTTTTSTTTSTTTTAPPGNGVATPTPIQEGMVTDCNKFDFIESGTSCSTVLSRNGLTIAQLFAMNPAVGKDCTGMWANVYVCVATIGGGSPTSGGPTTTTPPGNGIATPTPIQDGMVGNCNKFFFVESGTSCSAVLSKNGLTIAQLYAMNPGVNSDCTGMWANVYVCVGTTSGTTTTTTKSTTTTAGNGISTPTPIQDGMVSNCDAFYFVKKGTSCSTVLSVNGITIDQLFAWNPAVGKDCTSMWAEVYVCVSTTTHTPTPPTTTKGNGVTTPTPTQSGMVSNCKTFHFVKSGDTCDSISKQYSITTANFKKWNPAVGSDCTGMWKDAYVCVGLL